MRPTARTQPQALILNLGLTGVWSGAFGGGVGGSGPGVKGFAPAETGAAVPKAPTEAASCPANSPADRHSSTKARRNAAFPSCVNVAIGVYWPVASTLIRGPPNN